MSEAGDILGVVDRVHIDKIAFFLFSTDKFGRCIFMIGVDGLVVEPLSWKAAGPDSRNSRNIAISLAKVHNTRFSVA